MCPLPAGYGTRKVCRTDSWTRPGSAKSAINWGRIHVSILSNTAAFAIFSASCSHHEFTPVVWHKHFWGKTRPRIEVIDRRVSAMLSNAVLLCSKVKCLWAGTRLISLMSNYLFWVLLQNWHNTVVHILALRYFGLLLLTRHPVIQSPTKELRWQDSCTPRNFHPHPFNFRPDESSTRPFTVSKTSLPSSYERHWRLLKGSESIGRFKSSIT